MENKNKNKRDAQLVMKPIGALGGLDTIHVALIVLVVILVALLLMVSHQRSLFLNLNGTSNLNSTSNGKAAIASTTISGILPTLSPMHSRSQVIMQAEKILASYNYANGYISVLPHFSDVKNISASYMPSAKEWYVKVPESIGNVTGYYSFVIYDSNLSLDLAFAQAPKVSNVLDNYVAAKGVISLSGKFACGNDTHASAFWFIDPYAPSAISGMDNLASLENKYGSSLNVSLKLLSQGYTDNISKRYGLGNAQALERYILCASNQKNTSVFYTNLLSAYSGYMSPQLLSFLANTSKLNTSLLDSCIVNSTTELNRQALLGQYYNITTTPSVVVDCKYLAIPQTAGEAVCYGSPGLCSK